MRILLFYFAELGGLGGVEVVVLNLARLFTERGHPTGIVELAPERKPKRVLQGEIPVWSVIAPSYPSIRRPRSWAALARATLQFQEVVTEFNPDLVNVHFPLAQSIPTVGAHFLPHRWRLVVTVHNSDIRVAPFDIPPIRVWQAHLFSRADWVTAVSHPLLEDTERLYPGLSAKAEVIYNWVGSAWFQPIPQPSDGERKFVLFVGRFHEVKGVDLLLRAWQSLAPHYPAVDLWLAGDGEDRRGLEQLARELGILGRVNFLGRKQQDELPQLYRSAQVVVLPSRREGLPLTLLEAGACGAVCVGTRIPGIPEILNDGTTGFLADPESPDSLVLAISRALDASPANASRMREQARRNVRQNFSEDKAIARYLDRFGALLGRSPRLIDSPI
jgi:L-malate glycosyltransferase